MESKLSFNCRCGNSLEEIFKGSIYNYHVVSCNECGFMYDVHRPVIEVKHNLSRADEKWLKENGFEHRIEELGNWLFRDTKR